jgi:hypothetical protein
MFLAIQVQKILSLEFNDQNFLKCGSDDDGH